MLLVQVGLTFLRHFRLTVLKPRAQQQVQRLDTEYRALRDEMDKEVGATGETAEKIKVRSVALTWQPRMQPRAARCYPALQFAATEH